MNLSRFNRERSEIAAAVYGRVVAKTRRAPALIREYIDDIAGGFDARVYRGVTGALRPIGARLELAGPLDQLRELAERATLLFAPTHSSNLDSIVFGMALLRARLPASVYATGKHMYRNPVVAAFMRNLGAYRVDRAQTSPLYVLVLTEYSTELLDRGFHSIVFPGATRCRSNEVEHSPKLGLLRTALRSKSPVYIVPVTINYAAVLEAETLIRYHLEGRSHERIVGDELFGWGRLAALARRVWALSKSVVVRFDEPLPRGGTSRQLGEALVAAYQRNTVLFSTHIVGRALYDLAVARAGTDDITELLSLSRTELTFAQGEAHTVIARTMEMIRSAPDHGRLHRNVDRMAPEEIVKDARTTWVACHRSSVVDSHHGELVVEEPRLLYFYRNRSSHIKSRDERWM